MFKCYLNGYGFIADEPEYGIFVKDIEEAKDFRTFIDMQNFLHDRELLTGNDEVICFDLKHGRFKQYIAQKVRN